MYSICIHYISFLSSSMGSRPLFLSSIAHWRHNKQHRGHNQNPSPSLAARLERRGFFMGVPRSRLPELPLEGWCRAYFMTRRKEALISASSRWNLDIAVSPWSSTPASCSAWAFQARGFGAGISLIWASCACHSPASTSLGVRPWTGAEAKVAALRPGSASSRRTLAWYAYICVNYPGPIIRDWMRMKALTYYRQRRCWRRHPGRRRRGA